MGFRLLGVMPPPPLPPEGKVTEPDVRPGRFLCFDCETTLIGLGKDAVPDLVLAGVFDGASSRLLMADELCDWLESHLDDPSVVFVNQNAPFDFAVVVKHRPSLQLKVWQLFLEGRVLSTEIGVQLHDIATRGAKWRTSYSLQQLLLDLFDYYLPKDEHRLEYAKYLGWKAEDIPDGPRNYAINDAVAAWHLADFILDRWGATAPRQEWAEHTAAQWWLHRIETGGIHTDGPSVERLIRTSRKVQRRQIEQLLELGFLRPEITSEKTWTKMLELEPEEWPSPRRSHKTPLQAYQNGPTCKLDEEHKLILRRTRVVAEQAALAYAENGGLDWPLTDKGVPKLTRETAEELIPRADDGLDHPLLAFIDYGQAAGILAQAESLLTGASGTPIHFSYDTLKETGRTSSRGGSARINSQNMRRVYGFRESFVADPGCAIVSCDFAGQELRTLAQTCIDLFGYSKLADALNAGIDVHTLVAGSFAGLPDWESTQWQLRTDGFLIKVNRPVAKIFNFTMPGGGGEKTFIAVCRQSGVPVDSSVWDVEAHDGWKAASDPKFVGGSVPLSSLPEHVQKEAVKAEVRFGSHVKDAVFPSNGNLLVFTAWLFKRYGCLHAKPGTFGYFRTIWLQTFPEMADYFQHIKRGLRQLGGADSPLGRLYEITYPRFPMLRVTGSYNAACNTFFQALAARGSKRAGLEIQHEMECVPSSPLYGSRLCFFVHDEFGAMIPLDRLHEASYRLAEIQCEVMDRFTPDVPHIVEPAASRRWTKIADTRLHDGRLVPEEDYRLHYGVWEEEARKHLSDGKMHKARDAIRQRNDAREFFRRRGLTNQCR